MSAYLTIRYQIRLHSTVRTNRCSGAHPHTLQSARTRPCAGVTVSEVENETARPHSCPRNHVSNGASHSAHTCTHAYAPVRRKGRLCSVAQCIPCGAIVEKAATWIVVDATAALDVVARATVHDNTHATCGVTQAPCILVDRHCGKRFGAAVCCGYVVLHSCTRDQCCREREVLLLRAAVHVVAALPHVLHPVLLHIACCAFHAASYLSALDNYCLVVLRRAEVHIEAALPRLTACGLMQHHMIAQCNA